MSRFPSPFSIGFVQRCLAASPLAIIDVGAARGIDPLWQRFKSDSYVRCFGFEPNPEEFRELKPNANTQYFPVAVSDRTGELEFFAHSTIGGLDYRPTREAEEGIKFKSIRVAVDTLGNMRRNATLPSLDVVKSDTEGHELNVLRGVDDQFFPEILGVKTEILFAPTESNNSFADVDTLLRSKGLLFFGGQFNVGMAGQLRGGDVLYLRDIMSVIAADASDDVKRVRVAKLLCVCFFVRNLEYAYIVGRTAHEAGLVSESEWDEIRQTVATVAYLPNILPSSRATFFLATLFSMLGQLTAGTSSRTKSFAKDNRLDRFGPLFISSRFPGVRGRQERHLENRYHLYFARKGVGA